MYHGVYTVLTFSPVCTVILQWGLENVHGGSGYTTQKLINFPSLPSLWQGFIFLVGWIGRLKNMMEKMLIKRSSLNMCHVCSHHIWIEPKMLFQYLEVIIWFSSCHCWMNEVITYIFIFHFVLTQCQWEY